MIAEAAVVVVNALDRQQMYWDWNDATASFYIEQF